MNASTLRGLAQAYSDSLIDRKRYIRKRRQLIDDIVSGRSAIVPYKPPLPIEDPDLGRSIRDGENTLDLKLSDIVEANSKAPAVSHRATVVIVIISALLGGAWLAFTANSGPVTSALEQSENHARIEPRPNVAEQLLSQFLADNQWQNDHLEDLRSAWLDNPSAQRQAAANGTTVHRATELIVQKILEENAKLELGGRDISLIRQRQLLDLAAVLSPHNKRISRLNEEWHLAQFQLQPTESVELANVRRISTSIAEQENIRDEEADLTEDSLKPVSQDRSLETEGTDDLELTSDVQAKASEPVFLADNDPQEQAGQSLEVESIVAALLTNQAKSADTSASLRAPLNAATKNRKVCRAALAKRRRPYCRDVVSAELSGPELVVLPSGKFTMGGVKIEEQPRHSITTDKPFAVSIFEISNQEFKVFCTATKRQCPAQPWTDANLPMVNLSWTMATEYTQWLSQITGAAYRLASEAEWEYAARAGTTTVYPFGDEVLPIHARFSFRRPQTTPLPNNDRSINRNKFRLYHMIDNVREWVQDGWIENYTNAPSGAGARVGASAKRVVRGGSFSDGANNIRSASRTSLPAEYADTITGFRVVREVE